MGKQVTEKSATQVQHNTSGASRAAVMITRQPLGRLNPVLPDLNSIDTVSAAPPPRLALSRHKQFTARKDKRLIGPLSRRPSLVLHDAHVRAPRPSARGVTMNGSVGPAPRQPPVSAWWNGTTDDLGGGGGATNESEYDYDYEAALDTFFWSQLAPPLAVYAATYVVGVAGNGLIIFTICRFRRLKTTTNVFLASLASADLLLILLCIPVKVSRLTSRQPSLSCPVTSQPVTRDRTADAGWLC
ncbi:hypothetical protein O3P69_005984 [Scylla paramamosain]|uniref:G-protein coupled receptors family 1 profile domain-containing protein n=1 Tax=Scylla paramamosain TaxID=85552 RepID=A0AAW0U569_SCYPA